MRKLPSTQGPGASQSCPSGISSEFQLRKVVASQVSAQPGGGTRRRPNEASPATGGRPRHQEHRPAGEGDQGHLSRGTPPSAPWPHAQEGQGWLSPSASGRPPCAPPQQPGQGARGAISKGFQTRAAQWKIRHSVAPPGPGLHRGQGTLGGQVPRAAAHSGGPLSAFPARPPPTPTPLPSFPPPRWGAGVPLSSPAPPSTRAAVSAGRLAPQQATPRERQLGSAGAPPTQPRAPPDPPRIPRKRVPRLPPALRGDPRPQLTSPRWQRWRPGLGRARAAGALRQVAVPIGLGARSRPGLGSGRDPPAAAS